MRDNPVFVKRSLSLLERCFDSGNPRIIYSAPNLVFAIPWRASFDSSCQVVEAIGKGKKTGLNPTLIVYRKTGSSVYDEGHGCARCHGPDFKPKWENYPSHQKENWTSRATDPIGSKDDNVFIGGEDFSILRKLYADAKTRGVTNWFGPRMESFDTKADHLLTMKKAFKGDLESLRKDYEAMESMNLPFAFTYYENHTDILGLENYKSRDFPARPNLKLGVVLGELNAERMADRIFASAPRSQIEANLTAEKVCYFPYSAQVAPFLMELFELSNLSRFDLVLASGSTGFYYNGYMTHQEVLVRALLKRIGSAFNFTCGNFIQAN